MYDFDNILFRVVLLPNKFRAEKTYSFYVYEFLNQKICTVSEKMGYFVIEPINFTYKPPPPYIKRCCEKY